MKRRHSDLALRTLVIIALSCAPWLFSCSEAGKSSDISAVTDADYVPSETVTAAETSSAADKGTEAPFEAEGMRFSVKSGFYEAPFYLSISADDASEIYYTLDGSLPTAGSMRYEEPILITDRSEEENKLSNRKDIAQPAEYADDFVPRGKIDKATVLRAVRIDSSGTRSEVVSNTYFVGFDKKAEYYSDTKVVSLITDESSLFDYETGIYVLGKVYDDWKSSDEYDPDTPEWSIPGNYTQKGREWERSAAIQFFEEGELAAEQNVGIRIHGGATRSYPQKSINVYARKDYGAPKLEYDLFSGNVKKRSDGSVLDVFDTFILRNGGNDAQYTRFRDKLIQSLVTDRSFLTQGMEPCILFIDGEYWGQYEITEKLDADFISSHYGVPKKEICIIKKEALDEGSEETFAEWEKLRKWIRETDFSDQEAYDELCGYVDMQGFMDYISTEIYINNSDWGKPNMAMWKSEKTDKDIPYADGKWRFVLFDTEFSSGLYGRTQASDDSFERFMESGCFLADLFNGALENEGFRKQFRDTFMDIADNNFNDEKVDEAIDMLEEQYHDMIIDTYDRFWSGWCGGYYAESNYSNEVSALRAFFRDRHRYITKYLDKNVDS